MRFGGWAGILCAVFAFGGTPTMCRAQQENCEAQTVTPVSATERSISLHKLAQALAECQPRGDCSAELMDLGGMTTVRGFVIDAEAHDVILSGLVEPGAPNLAIEDFVVALRSAKHLYGHSEGNTFYYSNPGVSIDPDPRSISRLGEIARQIRPIRNEADVARNDATWDAWCDACRVNQKVSVFGIPFNSHFAHVMFDADYRMKGLADGTEEISGVDNIKKLTLDEWSRDVAAGSISPSVRSSLTRFWFYPGDHTYDKADGAVTIVSTAVKLLDEDQHVSRQGELTASNKVNAMSRKFACDFSRHYPAIAREGRFRVYTELADLFRWLALARLMVAETAFEHAGYEPDWWLTGFRVPAAAVPSAVVGVASLIKENVRSGNAIGYLRAPSCGGVDASFDDRNLHVANGMPGLSPLLWKSSVLASRPGPDAVAWISSIRR
jgi:hypothetical protein